MRGLSTIHLSTLLLVSALLPSSLDGLEEQWIGVQIEAGNFDVEVGADGAALRV